MAFSWTVVSTMTCSNSAGRTALVCTGGVDGCLEYFFHSGFADGGAKAPNLSRIAGQCRRVVVLTAEVLPHDVLRPAGDQFLVTQIKGVLEVKQCRHQPDRQTWLASRTDAGTGTGNFQRRPEQVIAWHHLARAILAGECRRQRRFDLDPQHSTCEHRQGVAQVNHLIESGAEKIVGDHQNFPQFLSGFHVYYFNFSEISRVNFRRKPPAHASF
jgi:hypothetical protein